MCKFEIDEDSNLINYKCVIVSEVLCPVCKQAISVGDKCFKVGVSFVHFGCSGHVHVLSMSDVAKRLGHNLGDNKLMCNPVWVLSDLYDLCDFEPFIFSESHVFNSICRVVDLD